MTDETRANDGEPRGLGIRLGTHRAPALGEVTVRLDEADHGMLGTVRIAAAALVGAPADYRAEALLEAGTSNLTGGWVTKAEVDADEVALEVRSSLPLSEQRIGYLSIANLTGDEMAWSMSHWIGMTPVVPGLRPVREVIAVAMPVEGLELTDDLDLGPVRLTRDRPLIEIMAAPLKASEEKEAATGEQGSHRMRPSTSPTGIRAVRSASEEGFEEHHRSVQHKLADSGNPAQGGGDRQPDVCCANRSRQEAKKTRLQR